jgi:hypothetical protein
VGACSRRFSEDVDEFPRLLGYLAAHSGFGAAELLGMNRGEVDFLVGCLSAHFAWEREQIGS